MALPRPPRPRIYVTEGALEIETHAPGRDRPGGLNRLGAGVGQTSRPPTGAHRRPRTVDRAPAVGERATPAPIHWLWHRLDLLGVREAAECRGARLDVSDHPGMFISSKPTSGSRSGPPRREAAPHFIGGPRSAGGWVCSRPVALPSSRSSPQSGWTRSSSPTHPSITLARPYCDVGKETVGNQDPALREGRTRIDGQRLEGRLPGSRASWCSRTLPPTGDGLSGGVS